MVKTIKASESFRFHTRLHLTEMIGLKAANAAQLCEGIREVPGSSIYHHTHRFLQIHQYLSPEPPNDFSYWVAEALGEDELAERLASIDTMQYSTLRDLREKIVSSIDRYLEDNPLSKKRFARAGEEFHFMKSVSFIIPTDYTVDTLNDFAKVLEKITIDSIYFHIFEARLRLEKKTNDFSYWIETAIGDKKLADEISRLDPYTRTMEDLRSVLIKKIKHKIEA
ncbi:MAG: hypothetical protein COV72_06790 [Candidatus Omnitrophica bacterium CG11_big_fil_rev_8_21_14_0_20_42_13]|uniref:Uncharacterized protein n=1 Tax=Candidatus Ghiorseimicrobium undicola TaxID=1974746 RepID=A0A2H0LYL7_9BACT|nr:MAG: hypothetical protein COV72_06790 [Candidatus Omnitrophica bacterium CG11_big_fil_rev_8_21_14_0_20_42_13]